MSATQHEVRLQTAAALSNGEGFAAAYEIMCNLVCPAPAAPHVPTEREVLKLRGNDEIDGDTIVFHFKGGRTVRVPKDEWASIILRNIEPHTIIAARYL